MRNLLFTLLGIGLFIPFVLSKPAWARPVSYPGGLTAMTSNDADKNTVHLHYSPTAKTSVGYKFEYWRDGGFTINAVQMNNLLKRWNTKESQANIYLKSGVGIAHSGNDDNAAGFTGVAMDWEDRRFFTSYENRYTEAGDIADFFTQSARVGVAPYIVDYGDLHTWLMLQVEHQPESKDHVTVTPLVRFFKDVHLLEAGVNTRGEILFNYVLRY
jgi:hypothetical protein